MTNATATNDEQFAIFAEAEGQPKPLVLTHLTFARLMDDVVVPYQTGEPFFIDGAPLKREKLTKLKIIKQRESFSSTFHDLHHKMRWGTILEKQRLYAEQYHVRLEALLRESGEDVTSQVIKAYDRTIKPSLKDWIPKREELTKAALSLFIESMKTLGGT